MSADYSRFADWVARCYPTPESVLSHPDVARAIEQAGVGMGIHPDGFSSPLSVDDRAHYLPSVGRGGGPSFGSKFSYRVFLNNTQGGIVLPTVLLKSFSTSTPDTSISTRDFLWNEYRETPADHVPADRSAELAAREAARAARIARAAELAAEADRLGLGFALEVYGAAVESGSHGYLERKGLVLSDIPGARIASAARSLRIRVAEDGKDSDWKSARVDRGDLLIPVACRETGAIISVQRVFWLKDRYVKRFISCTHARHGQLVIPGDEVRVGVEGIADAVAVHRFTGHTAVVAFSSGYYPGLDVAFIASDNDAAGIGGAERAGLGCVVPPVPGMDWDDYARAHGDSAALEAFSAAVAAFQAPDVESVDIPALPRLGGNPDRRWSAYRRAGTVEDAERIAWQLALWLGERVPHEIELDDLMGDLRDQAPAGLVSDEFLGKVRWVVSRRLEGRRADGIGSISLSPSALARHDYEVHDQLPGVTSADLRGVIILPSGLGTFKTERWGLSCAKHALALTGDMRTFVAVSHRRSLAADHARRLGVPSYEDLSRVGRQADFERGVAVCIPSLIRDDLSLLVGSCSFLFLDEVGQVLRAIRSATVASHRTREELLDLLRSVVTGAECVICADATIDDFTMEFLESCRPGERFRIIDVHKTHQGAVAFGVGGGALRSAYGEMRALMTDGKKIIVACGSAVQARRCVRVLSGFGYRVLLLTGDNKGDCDHFWSDPTRASLGYDAVVHSHVMTSGVSINHAEAHFDHGFLLSSGRWTTIADSIQMLRRVRYLKSWTVVVPYRTNGAVMSVAARTIGAHAAAAVAGVTAELTGFDQFCFALDACDGLHRVQYASSLWHALGHMGFSVTRLAERSDGVDFDTLHKEVTAERVRAILEARDLSDEEARELRFSDKTEDDALALMRYECRQELQADVLTEEDVEAWGMGHGLGKIDRFAELVGLVQPTVVPGSGSVVMRDWSGVRVSLYRWLFDGISIRDALFDDALALTVLERAHRDRFALSHLGMIPTPLARDFAPDAPFRAPSYPVRAVGLILARGGLELSRIRGTNFGPLSRRGLIFNEITGASGHDSEVAQAGSARGYRVKSEAWDLMVRLACRRHGVPIPDHLLSSPPVTRAQSSLDQTMTDLLDRGAGVVSLSPSVLAWMSDRWSSASSARDWVKGSLLASDWLDRHPEYRVITYRVHGQKQVMAVTALSREEVWDRLETLIAGQLGVPREKVRIVECDDPVQPVASIDEGWEGVELPQMSVWCDWSVLPAEPILTVDDLVDVVRAFERRTGISIDWHAVPMGELPDPTLVPHPYFARPEPGWTSVRL